MINQPTEKYEITFPVMISQTDIHGMLTLAGIGDMMQEAAARHADNLGWGFDTMRKGGKAWFLRNLRIRYLRPVKWVDALTVVTWPLEPDGLLFQREYRVKNKDGHCVAEGSSGWLLIDLETMKPVSHIPGLLQPLNYSRERIFPDSFPRIPVVKEAEKVIEFPVYLRFLDLNGHVNHVNYIRWLLDVYHLFSLKQNFPITMNIRFQHEMKVGETGRVEGSVSPESNHGVFRIIRTEDGVEVVRACFSESDCA